ncbi:Ribokinase-like protein [Ephemerocybe angulata]|uniref:Ribokinase-like protein n=1 Tax=Ephemerocybe angulata TaxID=980116 RepID=A0A8H6IE98_9AGAR|nr:Ribokinase-like protein [Tulosesus angulatus]
MAEEQRSVYFVTLGMFIIDEFTFADEDGIPTGKDVSPQESGGGTYAAIGSRIWLPAEQNAMVVDKGKDFPEEIEKQLLGYGRAMWAFRQQPASGTTRALNSYLGEHRNFEYLTPRIRITPKDLPSVGISKPATLHFICSPARASEIVSEVEQVEGWSPTMIYEPIPDRCIPEELQALRRVLHAISILSPNAEEALSMLSMPLPPSKAAIEQAADTFLGFGVGPEDTGSVVIRSGGLGAYVKSRSRVGEWVEAYWSEKDERKIVDVTGAGNSFLGGLAAGLLLSKGDVLEAAYYASVSASFVIEQQGLPTLLEKDGGASWNGDSPQRRVDELRSRHKRTDN